MTGTPDASAAAWNDRTAVWNNRAEARVVERYYEIVTGKYAGERRFSPPPRWWWALLLRFWGCRHTPSFWWCR